MNQDNALGLPPGSVRAILALILVMGLLAAVFIGQSGEAVAVIASMTGMALQAYFHRDRKSGD